MRRIGRAALAAMLACSMVPFAPMRAFGDEFDNAGFDAGEQGSYVEGEALVLYRSVDSASYAQTRTARTLAHDNGSLLEAQGFTVAQTWDVSSPDANAGITTFGLRDDESAESDVQPDFEDADLRIALVSKDGESTESLIDELNALDFVEVAEPNQIVTIDAAAPNDTYYEGWLYSMHSTESGIDLDAALDVEAAQGDSAEENIVAVLDTGVDFSNPDLASVAWQNPGNIGLEGEHGYDFGDGDADPTPDGGGDGASSHGTHCAGSIAAATNNTEGVAGIAQHTKIMGLKGSPTGAGGWFSASSAVAAYQYMIQAKVAGENVVAVNNSWHMGSYSAIFDYLVNQAGKAGIVSFFAAGNASLDAASGSPSSSVYGMTVGLESPYAVVVAASNEYNELATFTNYNETAVDVAAPGGTILSTVSTLSDEVFFNAQLSHQAGEQLLAYDDFSDVDPSDLGAYSWRLIYYGGETPQVIVSSEDADQSIIDIASSSLFDDPALQVKMDMGQLEIAMAQINPDWDVAAAIGKVRFEITKVVENPFRGKSADASRYLASVTPKVDEGMTTWTAVMASPVVRTHATAAEEVDPNAMLLVSNDTNEASYYDNFSYNSAEFSSVDTESDLLEVGAELVFGTTSTAEPMSQAAYEGSTNDNVVSATMTGFGIGTTDQYQPYAFMSGTSMATPTLVGAYAELASLYSDESSLELRGRLIGSTVDVAPARTNGAYTTTTATEGRFSFSAGALGDGSAVSANTWSAEADVQAGTVTLYGFGLGDAALEGDYGALLAIDSRAEDGSWVRVHVDSSLFDGEKHRFDVTDASTGKTHKASYTMPTADKVPSGEATAELTKAIDLPAAVSDQGAGRTVSTPVGVVYADGMGAYAYLCADPAAQDAVWTSLDSPGFPGESGSLDNAAQSGVRYGYANGTLYAMATDGVDQDDGTMKAVLYIATLDLSKGSAATWSPYASYVLGVAPAGSGLTVQAPLFAAADGTAYVYTHALGLDASTSQMTLFNAYLMTAPSGSADFSLDPLSNDAFGNAAPLCLVGGETLRAACYVLDTSTATGTFAWMEYDAASGAWTGDLASQSPTLGYTEVLDLGGAIVGTVGNGAVVVGQGFGDLGDAILVDVDSKSCVGLGSFGFRASEGYAAQDVVMFGGTTYVTALDARTAVAGENPTLGALYTLPAEAEAKLASNDRAATATATEGGTASVGDWRGRAADSIAVRAGDTASWSATASEGYRFEGWYDAEGTLVSGDATYAQVVSSDMTLQARFAKTGGEGGGEGADPKPTDPTGPTTDVEGADDALDSSEASDGSAKSFAKTGDATGMLAAGAAAAAALATAGAVAARRKMRGSE